MQFGFDHAKAPTMDGFQIAGGRDGESVGRTGDARLALILAAEKCIALKGVAGAPSLDIQKEAGQRNRSAIRYHFGSREGLIEAVLAYRITSRRARRVERFRKLAQDGSSLTDLVRLWVDPLAHELRPRREGNYYLRFADNLRREAPALFRRAMATEITDEDNMLPLLREIMPPMSAAARASRLGLAAELLQSSLAALEARLPQADYDEESIPLPALESLISAIAGTLSSTPSDAEQYGREDIDFGFLLLAAISPEPDPRA